MRVSSSDSPRHRSVAALAVFASVLFLALAIAVSGMISLLADRDVLVERDAGPLVAPAMFAVATVADYAMLVLLGWSRRRSIILVSLVSGLVGYLLFLLAGSVLYSWAGDRPLRGLVFFGSNALGPFAVAVLVIGVVITLCFLLLLAYRDGGGLPRTPRWPWEKREERERDG